MSWIRQKGSSFKVFTTINRKEVKRYGGKEEGGKENNQEDG